MSALIRIFNIPSTIIVSILLGSLSLYQKPKDSGFIELTEILNENSQKWLYYKHRNLFACVFDFIFWLWLIL